MSAHDHKMRRTLRDVADEFDGVLTLENGKRHVQWKIKFPCGRELKGVYGYSTARNQYNPKSQVSFMRQDIQRLGVVPRRKVG